MIKKNMTTPTLKEVKEHFKNARFVKSLITGEVFMLEHPFYFNHECFDNNNNLLWDYLLGYAEIITKNINIYGITRKKTKSKIDVLKDFINEFDTYNAKELSKALNMPILKLISEIDSIQGLSWMTISQKVYRLQTKGYGIEEINLTLNIKTI